MPSNDSGMKGIFLWNVLRWRKKDFIIKRSRVLIEIIVVQRTCLISALAFPRSAAFLISLAASWTSTFAYPAFSATFSAVLSTDFLASLAAHLASSLIYSALQATLSAAFSADLLASLAAHLASSLIYSAFSATSPTFFSASSLISMAASFASWAAEETASLAF